MLCNAAVSPPIKKQTKRFSAIFNSSLGNILEWYDFGLFAIFSSLFSRLFFPSIHPQLAIIATLSVLAVGFICRPMGALIFGYLGDKIGRAKTLRLSILMISLPTLFIGFLPTYDNIGIAAPICLVLIRIWQGISLGGEFSGNIIYLAETAPIRYRATITSLAGTGANIGILLASLISILISHLFTEETLYSWAWRIPYLLSGLLSLLLYFFRLKIPETETFLKLKRKHLIYHNPVKIALKKNYRDIAKVIGICCMGSSFYYFCFIYLPIFMQTESSYSIQDISFIVSCFIAAMIILVPLAGLICDRIGRRTMLLTAALLIIFCCVPGFYLLQQNSHYFYIPILLGFTLISSLEQGSTSVTVVELFPPRTRYSGLSLGYNIGQGFIGGTVPVISEWLIKSTQQPLAPALYISLCAVVTGLVVYFFIAETRAKNISN